MSCSQMPLGAVKPDLSQSKESSEDLAVSLPFAGTQPAQGFTGPSVELLGPQPPPGSSPSPGSSSPSLRASQRYKETQWEGEVLMVQELKNNFPHRTLLLLKLFLFSFFTASCLKTHTNSCGGREHGADGPENSASPGNISLYTFPLLFCCVITKLLFETAEWMLPYL